MSGSTTSHEFITSALGESPLYLSQLFDKAKEESEEPGSLERAILDLLDRGEIRLRSDQKIELLSSQQSIPA